jgi:hypothetical protein
MAGYILGNDGAVHLLGLGECMILCEVGRRGFLGDGGAVRADGQMGGRAADDVAAATSATDGDGRARWSVHVAPLPRSVT